MNSEHHKKEEWLHTLKDKMAHHQEPVPEQGWAALEQTLTDAKPLSFRRKWYRLAAAVSAVAAVILLFWILFPISPSLLIEETPQLAAVTPDNSAPPISSDSPHRPEHSNQSQDPGNPVYSAPLGKSNRQPVTHPPGESSSAEPIQQIAGIDSSVTDPSSPEKQHEILTAERQSLSGKQAESESVKKGAPEDLTWEEYLNREREKEAAFSEKKGNWLALSVGNSGVGTFDPRMADVAAVPMMQAAPAQMDAGVKDLMLYKRPEKLLMSPQAEAIVLEYRHKQPLSFGVKFGKTFSDKFTVETGLVYSLLRSDVDNLQKDKTLRQTLHYLGIPLRFNWNFVHKPQFAVYAGVGGMVEKCISGELNHEKLKIKSVQTSLNLSVGAQYKFSPVVGIYFEPGLSYYLGMKEDGSLGTTGKGTLIKSIHSENPLGFTLQAGFRFSF